MNDFVFHSPTEFIFGRGVEAQAGEHSNVGTIGAALGFVIMMILEVTLG